MTDSNVKLLKPRFPWQTQAILPAEVSDGLKDAMLRRENLLEDVHYNKIAPNHFVVELSPENYQRHYQPIEADILQQWREKLLEHLMTANNRLGRKEYRLGGQLLIEMRPGDGLEDSQARILSQIQPDVAGPVQRRSPVAFLEMPPSGKRWPLYEGDNSLGRDPACDIHLDIPEVQERRLVSGQHAFIHCQSKQCTLHDGSLQGKPSSNGTYLNSQRVYQPGQILQEGDVIQLAAADPQHPARQTPGVVVFRFHRAGEE